MGCTPSMHVSQTGVVHCSQDDDTPATGQLTGVQGHFRPTCDGEEGTSKESQDSVSMKELSAYEKEYLQGSLLFQKKDKNEVSLISVYLPNPSAMAVTEKNTKILSIVSALLLKRLAYLNLFLFFISRIRLKIALVFHFIY